MKRKLLLTFLLATVTVTAVAQRLTDKLDRGLVAVKTSKGVFCSWRIPAEEYYDVQYNIYRDGTKLNSTPLNVSNYLDKSGTTGSTYTVEPVVRGVAQSQCAASSVWSNNYLEVTMDHGDLTSTYVPNDACCADVDGDGQVEILLKFDNRSDAGMPAGYNGEYAIIEVYKLNGKKLWWIDLGPNMADFQNNENNIVAFDWDRDGKAEAIMRAADGTTIHTATGKTVVIGDKSKNYRPSGGPSGEWFIHEGAEYLLYLNGETGEVYQQMEYPLKRLEDGETSLDAAWGDGYGHRSTKHFFGAPFLDGKKASIFLARGIYTRHKMVAFDVDPATHQLSERWRWVCNTSGPWYGQGYHNYSIADVDMDGRDEIVFGSMVIDDNGKGLSTSGLGHGDAHHVGDFDPYTWGLEVFACNEAQPMNNFRDATTSKIYYRATGGSDDGRSIAGNFLDEYPGAQGRSARDGLIGGASHKALVGAPTSGIATNFRIYWDGDLLEETFNYVSGKNTEGGIYKGGVNDAIATLAGSKTNNDTKGTPCYQGDVLGDWREEVIMRTAANNIRIYTTNIETEWRNYSLWHDHQYRNAMVWQMCGYNQPPHASYFLGKLEGITVAPPPLTTVGRTEIADEGTIGTDCNDKHIMTDKTGDMTVTVTDGATPYIYTDNTPSHVEGTAPSNCTTKNTTINYTYYTHTLKGGAFAGGMRLVKQGEGTLVLPNVVETYTGNTDIWNGTLSFDGTLLNSPLWLNRHTTLISDGGKFPKGIRADYNATIIPGGKDEKGSIETDSLKLGFGSRVQIDLFNDGTADGISADTIKANTLVVEKKDWLNGPKYLVPVFVFVPHPADGASTLADGKYLIGKIGKVEGSLDDIIIEGIDAYKHSLVYEDGWLYVSIAAYVSGNVVWTGSESGVWDLDATANFANRTTQEASTFVRGDEVTFDDSAVTTDIVVTGKIAPSKVTFNNDEKAFTIKGDSIVGGGELVKNGEGSVVIYTTNHIGNTTINGGKLNVASLANNIGQDYGSLGGVDSKITIDNNATLTMNLDATTTQEITVGTGGATIEVGNGRTLALNTAVKSVNSSSAVLTKAGAGSLTLSANNRLSRLIVNAGNVNAVESGGTVQLPSTVELVNGTITDPSSENSFTSNNTNFVVPESGVGYLIAKPRCTYNGSLTGAGTFTVYAAGVRNYFAGDWSQFEGTIIPAYRKRGSFDPSFDFTSDKGMPLATLQVNSGIEFKNSGKNVEIGSLDGEGTLSGAGTYVLGSNNADFKFKGSITSAVNKAGTGCWEVTNAFSGIGSITVSAGSLYINSLTAKDMISSTGLINVLSGATLLGRGGVTTTNLRSGATLKVGTNTDDFAGEFRVTGNLTALAGSTVNMNIKNANNLGTSRSFLNVTNYLTFNATVNITLSPGYTPAAGDEIILWNAGTFNGNPTVNLPELPSGLYWDTSDLLTKSGTLRVTDTASGIAAATSATPVRCRMFTVSGILVAEFDATLGEAAAVAKKNAAAAGTYLLQISSSRDSKTLKLSVR